MNSFVAFSYYAASIAVLIAAISVVLGRGRPAGWAQALTAIGLGMFGLSVVQMALHPPTGTFDFSAFCDSGREALAGHDPIDLLRTTRLPPLNPPTAFPLFAAFALGPMPVTFAGWTFINAVMSFGLIPLVSSALKGSDESSQQIPKSALFILATLIALSNATRACLGSGQLSIATAFAIVLALIAQSAKRPIVAGVSLALATIKIGTMLPFLLLFLHRTDRKTWIALIVVTATLCLTTGHALDTEQRMITWVQGIGRLSSPGNANDFTYASPDNGDMIGLDHAFYRVGFKSVHSAKLVQYVILGVIGGWLMVQAFDRSGVSEGAKRSYVALFAMIFLYHRLSDAVILALPLIHVTGRARASRGRASLLFAASALSLLPILFMQRRLMKEFREFTEHGGWLGRVTEVALSPYACWLLLASMVLLYLGERTISVQNQAR